MCRQFTGHFSATAGHTTLLPTRMVAASRRCAYAFPNPVCKRLPIVRRDGRAADTNQDTVVNGPDVAPSVAALVGADRIATVPEPATAVLLALACWAWPCASRAAT